MLYILFNFSLGSCAYITCNRDSQPICHWGHILRIYYDINTRKYLSEGSKKEQQQKEQQENTTQWKKKKEKK